MALSGLIPARFLALTAQLVFTIVLYLSMVAKMYAGSQTPTDPAHFQACMDHEVHTGQTFFGSWLVGHTKHGFTELLEMLFSDYKNCSVLSCLPKTQKAAYDGTFGSACQPPDNLSPYYSSFTSDKTELTIALSISLGLLVFELVGLMGGISTFMHSQGLISTGCHAAGAICIVLYRFDAWCATYYWFIFGFCCAAPFVTECGVWLGVLAFKKVI